MGVEKPWVQKSLDEIKDIKHSILDLRNRVIHRLSISRHVRFLNDPLIVPQPQRKISQRWRESNIILHNLAQPVDKSALGFTPPKENGKAVAFASFWQPSCTLHSREKPSEDTGFNSSKSSCLCIDMFQNTRSLHLRDRNNGHKHHVMDKAAATKSICHSGASLRCSDPTNPAVICDGNEQ